ncbi:N-acetyltransferase [Actinoplanes sp. NBRC 14428]|uniref:Diamine N-acetyltransferase n=1 Tax=Pseudosporangium ferrugineum TaxID=439699 RepID=A0A2T0S7U7_9ACTN|nr:GNAT family N-acetyltransferase [Pseudosporangium ferrugineum]PRY29499.1 diamine N-acetyltransferase [Pseudosporangium ferrugineum]BCJ52760.1 N-acetyltransferase [Actinoplanes sp. NBRC 14428]
MTVELRPVTRDNFRAVIRLEVGPDQDGFVAPNVVGIAQAYVHPGSEPFAVYADDELVGFVLLQPGERAGDHVLVRLMIDHRFQGRGFGRQALEAAVDHAAREHKAEVVRLSFVPANDRARALYLSAGFLETGELDDTEIVMARRV